MRRLLKSVAQEFQSAALGAGGAGGYGFGNGGGAGGFGLGGGYGFGPSPQVPQSQVPCPRQEPQAGHQDWIGLNDLRFAHFNICPTCYNALVRPTPYAAAFVTKGGPLAPPPNVPVRCDMSRFWVRIAGMVLLTMNQDRRHDITLLAHVAGLRAQEGACPNAALVAEHQPLATAQRTWYTIYDPQTGAQPLPGWTVCPACVLHLQACCPAVAGGFAPVQQPPAGGPREGSCALVPSDRYDDRRTAEMLQQVAACAATAAMLRRPDLTQLVNWLRANPPQPRGGGGISGGGFSSSLARPQPNGLCPMNYPSTTLRCHTMQGLFEFTVCEQCYANVIRPDASRGVGLATRFDNTPSAIPSGFTCQLYSDRMRRVWSETVATGNVEYLRQKVSERRVKERELQTKTAQLQQQASQLRLQAETQERLANSAMSVAINSAGNNIMLAGIGAGYRIDSHTIAVPSGVPDFSQSTQLNNQAARLKVQAAQAEDQIRFAEEEWRRYWE